MNFKARLITHELFSGVTFGIFLAVQAMFILEKGVEVWQIIAANVLIIAVLRVLTARKSKTR